MKAVTRLAVCSVFLLAADLAASAQLSGSIYTTDRNGDVLNVFKSDRDVWFAGGPGPNAGCLGSGLVDGNYYFQVTDTSGRVLLSSDPITSREVVVSGGVITGTTAGGHATRNGPCGSSIVQLRPFDPSPSSGDEYKVWLTPIASYAPGQGANGFLSTSSKTDNFKLRGKGQPQEQTLITGTVFYDLDEDGVLDAGEAPLAGWKVELSGNGQVDETFADVDGTYEFLRDQDFTTQYVLTSIPPPPGPIGTVGGRWLATSPTPVTFVANQPLITVDFGNLEFESSPQLARSKGFWQNQGESLLAACDPLWRDVLNGLCLRTNFSNPDGEDGTLFTVSTGTSFAQAYSELQNYLVGDPALGVLAFILSTQYGAANLNKSCGPLQVTTYHDRFKDDVLVSFEDMAADTLALLCDPRSANTGPNGDPYWRSVVMMCLMEWDDMNSGGDSIFSPRLTSGGFSSPY